MRKLISIFSLTLMFSSFSYAADINLWREPAPVVKEGKRLNFHDGMFTSVIADRGELTRAIKSSNGNYLFSEKGAGVKPLVLVGTPTQITEFLLENQTVSIFNEIKELPDIYMGVTNYIPKKRFTGLFPLNDVLVKTSDALRTFLPDMIMDLDFNAFEQSATVPGDLKGLYEVIRELSPKERASGKVLYVKLSYLPEEGMKKIGEKKINFRGVLDVMRNDKR